MTDQDTIAQHLEALRAEHQSLNAEIDALKGRGDNLENSGAQAPETPAEGRDRANWESEHVHSG